MKKRKLVLGGLEHALNFSTIPSICRSTPKHLATEITLWNETENKRFRLVDGQVFFVRKKTDNQTYPAKANAWHISVVEGIHAEYTQEVKTFIDLWQKCQGEIWKLNDEDYSLIETSLPQELHICTPNIPNLSK